MGDEGHGSGRNSAQDVPPGVSADVGSESFDAAGQENPGGIGGESEKAIHFGQGGGEIGIPEAQPGCVGSLEEMQDAVADGVCLALVGRQMQAGDLLGVGGVKFVEDSGGIVPAAVVEEEELDVGVILQEAEKGGGGETVGFVIARDDEAYLVHMAYTESPAWGRWWRASQRSRWALMMSRRSSARLRRVPRDHWPMPA